MRWIASSFAKLLCNFLNVHEGIAQLKEKWSNYKHPRRLRKSASLFVSPGGDLVAVASRNQITILRKEDDYQEPCGIFTCKDHKPVLYQCKGLK